MNYYMITVYTDEKTNNKYYRPFINPYESLKEAKRAADWQKTGGFELPIIAKRLSKSEFSDIKTKEIIKINIEDRRPYTIDAWNEFINRKY